MARKHFNYKHLGDRKKSFIIRNDLLVAQLVTFPSLNTCTILALFTFSIFHHLSLSVYVIETFSSSLCAAFFWKSRNWVEASHSRESIWEKNPRIEKVFSRLRQFSAHSLGGLFTLRLAPRIFSHVKYREIWPLKLCEFSEIFLDRDLQSSRRVDERKATTNLCACIHSFVPVM